MQSVKSVRATIIDLPVGDCHEFDRETTTERYVSHICSRLKNERGWKYSVSSPMGSIFIKVTRIE